MKKYSKKKDPHASREAQKYDNPIPSREFILEHLAERGRPATYPQVQEELGLNSDEQQEALRRRLIAMVRDGQLYRNRKGAYGPAESMELIAGRVTAHKDGFGFVIPDEGGEDLFLTPREMRQVFHGDRVLARVTGMDRRGRREGMIVDVLERMTQQLVGRFIQESGATYVEPSSQRIAQRILIPPESTKGAESGQVVVVAITSQPTQRTMPLGAIIEVVGDHMAPGMEIAVAIRNHDLPNEWPEAVLQEASSFPSEVQAQDIKGRKDYRHLPFVTIDGEDAKDFDDAVYCEPKAKGGWRLFVAIADVSYYVRPNSLLEKEGYKRGNSVYFPGRVIPMLPEVLSNNLCSLNPRVDRLVMVCEMSINESGQIDRHAFHEAVICSHERLTYTQVHAMLTKKDRRMRERFKDRVPDLENLHALYKVLRKAREQRGAIDFDMPETKIVFGKDRKIDKIVPYERFESHRLIEECMLSANICAARFLEKSGQLGLFRVHEGPTVEKIRDLQTFMHEIGLKMDTHRDPVPADYAKILKLIDGRPDAHMIQAVLLRSMRQAIYSGDNKGHFGLAYDAYAHFTSPIRRYPDLLVHRAIKQGIAKKKSLYNESDLTRIGEHCSMTERRADDATQEVTDWLKCEFMMDKVGEEYEGIISGVMGFGIFVEPKDVYVEGLVHISTLPGDYYQFDSVQHCLNGERSGRRFRLGDPVKVRVARVDLDQGQIDFVLAEVPKDAPAPRRSSKKATASRVQAGAAKKKSSRKKANTKTDTKRSTKKPAKKSSKKAVSKKTASKKSVANKPAKKKAVVNKPTKKKSTSKPKSTRRKPK